MLVPGAFARVSLTLKGKQICTLAPSRFINCPRLVQKKFANAVGGSTKHRHLCGVEEKRKQGEWTKTSLVWVWTSSSVSMWMCSKKPVQQHSISHGPACLQSLNQPWTTEHRLFIFHSTKDLETYCKWGLGPHSTLCQGILPSEKEKDPGKAKAVCSESSQYWMTNNNLYWFAEKQSLNEQGSQNNYMPKITSQSAFLKASGSSSCKATETTHEKQRHRSQLSVHIHLNKKTALLAFTWKEWVYKACKFRDDALHLILRTTSTRAICFGHIHNLQEKGRRSKC